MPASPTLLTLTAGDLVLEVLSTGASVRRLTLGAGPNLVLGHAELAGYAEPGRYLGPVVGRVANRLDRGVVTLDGTEHRLATNEAGNTLHGGPDGFDARAWEVLDAGPAHATLGLTSPDGDQGFPGRLEARAAYTVAPGEVRLRLTARTDATTLVNLTSHLYVQLDGEGSGPVDDHVLEVDADAFLPVRPDGVPTGEVRPVEGTPFDLRSPGRLGDVLAAGDEQQRLVGGLDHTWVVRGHGMRRAVRVTGAEGRWLEVHTDQPGVQVYTGAHFDGTLRGTGGAAYGPRAGLALETQGFPDAPHHPHFPSIVLRPGEEYTSTTVWRLG